MVTNAPTGNIDEENEFDQLRMSRPQGPRARHRVKRSSLQNQKQFKNTEQTKNEIINTLEYTSNNHLYITLANNKLKQNILKT